MCFSITFFHPIKNRFANQQVGVIKIADNADVCFPSLNYLAQYYEMSIRTVKRHVNELEKQRFVKRIKQFDDSERQRSNIYQLCLPNGSHIKQADID